MSTESLRVAVQQLSVNARHFEAYSYGKLGSRKKSNATGYCKLMKLLRTSCKKKNLLRVDEDGIKRLTQRINSIKSPIYQPYLSFV